MIYEIVVDSVLHVAILLTVLVLLWYFVIRPFEQKQINDLIQGVLDGVSNDTVKYMHELLKPYEQEGVSQAVIDNVSKTLQFDLEEQAEVIQRDRANVRNAAFIFVALIWVIAGFAMYGLRCREPDKLRHICTVNFFIFMTLIPVEIAFYFLVVQKYIPITESEIRNKVFTQLEEKLKRLIHSLEHK
jgi:hypothetical protein